MLLNKEAKVPRLVTSTMIILNLPTAANVKHISFVRWLFGFTLSQPVLGYFMPESVSSWCNG